MKQWTIPRSRKARWLKRVARKLGGNNRKLGGKQSERKEAE